MFNFQDASLTNCEYAFLTVANKDTFTRCSNKDVGLVGIVDLDLVTVIDDLDSAVCAVYDVEWLAVYGS